MMWSTDFVQDFPDLKGCLRPPLLIQWCFIILFTTRYLRLVVHTIAHWRYKSMRISDNPTLSCKDVTIILPTISTDVRELRRTIQSTLACNPFQIFVVTTEHQYDIIQKLSRSMNARNLKVLKIPIPSKRAQVCEAIPLVQTPIIVLVDDDFKLPNTILPWLLAPFEVKEIGGVGTCQRVRRLKTGSFMELCYNWLGAAYIERRNFEVSATHHIDGGTSCMSGRTLALRSSIAQDPYFLSGFAKETWRRRTLNADDDNFIMRWLVAKGYKTWIQYNSECEVETTLENNSKFLYQCLRWARSNWRSNLKSMFIEKHIWKKQPWCSYALHFTMFINFAVVDVLLLWLCYRSTSSYNDYAKKSLRIAFEIWWLITKNIKLIRLYKVTDFWFMPVSILFGYLHGVIKLYALFTLHETGWGSRSVLEP